MKNNYLLIDYENVQPNDIDAIKNHPFKVFVFIGANQTKLSFDFVSSLQQLGENAEYIQISGNGPNALDFHIAFYIGQLAERDTNAYFHIISKDTGFDPLIQHLRDKKILIQRCEAISNIVILSQLSQAQKIQHIIQYLDTRKNGRPKTLQAISNVINSLFGKQLDDAELLLLVQQLEKRNYICINDKNISYQGSQTQSPAIDNLSQTQAEKIQLIVANLVTRGNSRPRSLESLSNTINHLFKKQLKQSELRQLIQQLEKQHYIRINNDCVSYNIGRLQQKY